MDPDPNSDPVLFDDTNPFITYTPLNLWILGGGQDEHNASTHGTLTVGAEARVAFTGTSIAVYGTLIYTTRELVSSYTLDNTSHPTTFTAPHWVLPPSSSSPSPSPTSQSPTPTTPSPTTPLETHPTSRPQYLLFRSPTLPDGPHTLLISTIIADSGFWLDYFAVTGAEPRFISWEDAITGSGAGAGNRTGTGTGDEAGEGGGGGGGGKHVGAIVGGVVGGVAGLLIVLLLLWYWVRHRPSRIRAPSRGWTEDTGVEAHHTPDVGGRYTVHGGTIHEKRAAQAQIQVQAQAADNVNNTNAVVDVPPEVQPSEVEVPPAYESGAMVGTALRVGRGGV